jgi:hypothetical protein
VVVGVTVKLFAVPVLVTEVTTVAPVDAVETPPVATTVPALAGVAAVTVVNE